MNEHRTIAYFSMEVGVEPAMPTYSGGLGVLAGDTIRSAADLRVSMVAGHTIDAITNGVHAATWISHPFQELYDRNIPDWREDNFSP